MYKVIKRFHDLQDVTKTKSGKIYREYNVGDEYPRKGFQASDERLKELSGNDNKQGVPLIELVEEKVVAKKTVKKTVSGKSTTNKTTTKATAK